MRVDIEDQTGKKKKVYVEGSFIGALYPNEIRRFGLENDGDISETDLEELMKEVLLRRAKLRLMNILMRSDKSETELQRRLQEDGYCQATVAGALQYVRDFHYVDDLRTAGNFIRSKMNGHSEREIRYLLEQKGISSEYIDMAYSAVLEEDENEDPELAAVEGFIRRKLGSRLSSINEMTSDEKQKLYAAAYRKGFKGENIRKVIREFENTL